MTKDVIEQVALVSGKVLHRGTGLPIDGTIAIEAQEGPVAGRVLEDGTFVVSGRPELLFPLLALGPATFHVTMHAQSGEFTQGTVDQPLPVNVALGYAFDTPLDQGNILLPVAPVDITQNLSRTIRGLVTDAADPRPPIFGTTIDILQSGVVTNTTTTDAQGRFGFDDIVVAAPAEIRASEAVHKQQRRRLLIDFHFSMHEELFRLVHI
jgi:hypothetical protein